MTSFGKKHLYNCLKADYPLNFKLWLLNNYLKKLDFVETNKQKGTNLYKIKGVYEKKQPTLFD